MSRELPIIFNTEMVKAILDGRKVSTRRPVKNINNFHTIEAVADEWGLNFNAGTKEKPHYLKSPYLKDDILYVRETWGAFEDCHIDTEEQRYFYRADMDGDSEEIRQEYIRIGYPYQFKPSIHMPKKAARLFLKVTNVRVERVQDIREMEAFYEGVTVPDKQPHEYHPSCKEYFKEFWNNLYGNWDNNPWVWAIDFEVVKNV